jgi:molecular chaperone Hsp33
MNEDRLLSILLRQGDIRIIAISGRDMVEEARRIHSLSRVCTAALGRQLMATAMMASQLKHESESLTTIFRGDGPAGNLVCTGRYGGAGKGLYREPIRGAAADGGGKAGCCGRGWKNGHPDCGTDLSLREP